jgi:eukaryotic-like serine/threonine-protein kinase
MKLGDLVAGRYELEELAGAGAVSSVYRAYDRLLERRVAFKVLHEEFARDQDYVQRFRREAQALARLSHPNIVTVIGRGEWEQHQFIVFEYVEGETLQDLVRRRGPLPVREALAVARDVAGGLAFAHEHGVVHRDIKAHNVIVDAEGTPKVTNFGLGLPLDRQEAQSAPGLLLCELLTGEVPDRADDDSNQAVRVSRADLPAEVDELVRRATQEQPEDRLTSLRAFLDGLEACLARYEEDTLSDVRFDEGSREVVRRSRWRRKSWLRVFAVLLVVAAATVGAVVVLRNGGNVSSGGEEPDDSSGPQAIRLAAVADHDPDGDQAEHPEVVQAATDRDPETSWTTETYSRFEKSGVGIVLRASEPVDGGTVVVRSDEDSGYTAEIQASSRRGGGFTTVSEAKPVGRRTAFELDTGGDEYRFLLVWITDLGPSGRAHVNEVRFRAG